MSEYKTFEELKEELGDEFEDYMYKANIELLNKLQQKENIIKEVREEIKDRIERNKDISYIEITNKAYVREQEELLEILDKNFKLEETPKISKLYINNELQYNLKEEKEIPEKLGYQDNADGTFYLNRKKYNSEPIKILSKKMNEIIDYLNYLKSKGE